jgi:DNA polymerase I-like protein with 3'-5' exonuclease and polymerase domains
MARPVLHPSFNVLARSGRTSSFGEINAQNLPKSDAVRACFVPRSGHEFIDADYATI